LPRDDGKPKDATLRDKSPCPKCGDSFAHRRLPMGEEENSSAHPAPPRWEGMGYRVYENPYFGRNCGCIPDPIGLCEQITLVPGQSHEPPYGRAVGFIISMELCLMFHLATGGAGWDRRLQKESRIAPACSTPCIGIPPYGRRRQRPRRQTGKLPLFGGRWGLNSIASRNKILCSPH
jgi:hypothetical protein